MTNETVKQEEIVFDKVRTIKGEPCTVSEAIMKLMHADHYVYVVNDSPNNLQREHVHVQDWSLVIVKGQLTILVGDDEHPLDPGDRLLLPANTVHNSRSGEEGCFYLEVPAKQALGLYAKEDENMDWKQFFTNNAEEEILEVVEKTETLVFDGVRVIKGKQTSLNQAVLDVMPKNHYVGIMNDSANAVKENQSYTMDLSLYGVYGQLEVTVNGETFELNSGDRLLLPANTVYSTKAGDQGGMYLTLKHEEEGHYLVRA